MAEAMPRCSMNQQPWWLPADADSLNMDRATCNQVTFAADSTLSFSSTKQMYLF
jgi:hypothetical protein